MQYKAEKSVWAAISFWGILFCWLIIPLIIMIYRIVRNAYDTIEFYDNKVVAKSGILSKKEKANVFTGVISVSVNQSIFGRIFGYGDVYIDTQGRFDVNTQGIKNPHALKDYLENRIVDASKMTFVSQH